MEMFSKVQEEKEKGLHGKLTCKKQIWRLLTHTQKEIIQIAAKNGSLTPEVIRELLKQQTAQKEIESKNISED